MELLEEDISLGFFPFDLEEYKIKRGLCLPFGVLAVGPRIKSQQDLLDFIINNKKYDSKYSTQREILKNLFFEVQKGKSCDQTMEAINNLLNIRNPSH